MSTISPKYNIIPLRGVLWKRIKRLEQDLINMAHAQEELVGLKYSFEIYLVQIYFW